ncbi:hypothetical protein POL58_33995 [Nannocystis sp. ncelm1]|uniref:Uncharacterized protein n=1 Tax=Nannocystis radixulma TaxID=2995305 RepID=A0ABT5BF97_9BACT|nr:hypothetical protein [Nannocystis radixulma]MDC0672815.1 hypothetical protein [Nannocystis radixulma]
MFERVHAGRAGEKHDERQRDDVPEATAAHAPAERAHPAIDGTYHPHQPDAAGGTSGLDDPERAEDPQQAQRGEGQRQRGQPVAAQVGELGRREREADREVDEEDDPDRRRRQLEEARQAPDEFDDEQGEPDQPEDDHGTFEPALEPMKGTIAFDAQRVLSVRRALTACHRRCLCRPLEISF